MNCFLKYNGIIYCSLSRNEAALLGAYNVVKIRSNSIYDNFFDSFLNGATEDYRSIMSNLFRVFIFLE